MWRALWHWMRQEAGSKGPSWRQIQDTLPTVYPVRSTLFVLVVAAAVLVVCGWILGGILVLAYLSPQHTRVSLCVNVCVCVSLSLSLCVCVCV